GHVGNRIRHADRHAILFYRHQAVGSCPHPMIGVAKSYRSKAVVFCQFYGTMRSQMSVENTCSLLTIPPFPRSHGCYLFRTNIGNDVSLPYIIYKSRKAVQSMRSYPVAA